MKKMRTLAVAAATLAAVVSSGCRHRIHAYENTVYYPGYESPAVVEVSPPIQAETVVGPSFPVYPQIYPYPYYGGFAVWGDRSFHGYRDRDFRRGDSHYRPSGREFSRPQPRPSAHSFSGSRPGSSHSRR